MIIFQWCTCVHFLLIIKMVTKTLIEPSSWNSCILFVIAQNGGPTSVEVVGSCSYNIRWETPVACPRNAKTSGVAGSCSVTDTTTGVVYDLRALARTSSDYAVNSSGKSFKVLSESLCTWLSELVFGNSLYKLKKK